MSTIVQQAITAARMKASIEPWPPRYAKVAEASLVAAVAAMECGSTPVVQAAADLLRCIIQETEEIFACEREVAIRSKATRCD